MYKEHFGLNEPPFSIAPDPRYLYMSEHHQEALAHLIYGIRSDGGFVLLTGEVGTGKTTVCRCLLEQVPENTDIAFILNPKVTAGELLAALCDELGIKYPESNTSIKVFVDLINAYLLEAHAGGRRTVLIIEEAQNLDPDVLEQVRLLTNLETNERKLLQIIMLGQPELRGMLSRPELRQLAQRITARYHLGPLAKQEMASYISHRLAVAGTHRKLFHPSTFDTIFRLSGGVPRLINVLCDRALLGAFAQGVEQVDRHTLSQAAREVFGKVPGVSGRRKVLNWAGAGIVILGCIVLLALHYTGFQQRFSVNAAPGQPVGKGHSRIPPEYKGSIRPGQQGKIVEWLDRRMSEIKGTALPVSPRSTYNGSLVVDIRKFQAGKGLVPDGVVGPRTMIYLVAEDGKGAAPVVVPGRSGK